MNETTEKLVYTVRECAVLLGLSLNNAYRAVAAGEIPSVKIGKRVVVPKARLQALLNGASGAKEAA